MMNAITELLSKLQNSTSPLEKETITRQLEQLLDEEVQYFTNISQHLAKVSALLAHQHDPPPLDRYYKLINF